MQVWLIHFQHVSTARVLWDGSKSNLHHNIFYLLLNYFLSFGSYSYVLPKTDKICEVRKIQSFAMWCFYRDSKIIKFSVFKKHFLCGVVGEGAGGSISKSWHTSPRVGNRIFFTNTLQCSYSTSFKTDQIYSLPQGGDFDKKKIYTVCSKCSTSTSPHSPPP